MQTVGAMMLKKKKSSIRALEAMIAAMPAMPHITRSRRRASMMAYLIGGIGLAIAGGIAALMLLSPRARHKALDVAKGTYDRVNEKISHARSAEAEPMADGLIERDEDRPTAGV